MRFRGHVLAVLGKRQERELKPDLAASGARLWPTPQLLHPPSCSLQVHHVSGVDLTGASQGCRVWRKMAYQQWYGDRSGQQSRTKCSASGGRPRSSH